ncbi:hypothetical protein SAMN05216429_101255 [Marinobacter persicus]|uniref:PilZ domain-containing protein n=1 Tax=Marinobacter persicus TaxID=930118 RepID=A0A1I3PNK4_9GAMM|nr:PilZ domain-containing protein [Marinobacter persicus]GHD54399.1 hypothetical protein GCM10008110_28850 [Marinobacter persicus]SFJ22989.1 hypothetical protein SAMN05216429_101255 [Marinobacter persicus]
MGKAASFETGLARRVRIKTPTVRPSLRNQQRVDVTIDVTLESPDGQCVVCKALNLSRAGVMLCCDKNTVQQLIPGMRPPAPGNWIDIKTRFPIPLSTRHPENVSADGHIIHMRRVSRDEFQIGVQFCEFEGNGFDYIDKFVSKLLAEQKTGA